MDWTKLIQGPYLEKNLLYKDEFPVKAEITDMLAASTVHPLSSGKVAATRPIAIFTFYSLNYSLALLLQDNYRPKSPTKVETKRKLQQFTVSGWLILNGGESGSEKSKRTLRLRFHSIC